MGVPAFFRWLTKKYPSIVLECIDERPVDANGTPLPFDASGKNPNDIEFDNLYLDMNGIIHPCTHPENKPAPKNEDEMMIAIFECIDHLFSIVRPRKLLYMAIDGVAPRAKMNQQRSRRFRASKESQDKIIEIASIKKSMLEKGYRLPPEKEKEAHFDSNCITPGTPFMARLAKCLNFYIHDRLNNDPGWKGVQVILSDANVPGEGEHKIMDFIRRQRAQPHHNPNTQHCLCGADADLIMLGLATHEPNFTIIREEFQYNQQRRCEICGQDGHEMKECQGLDKKFDDHAPKKIEGPQKYIFVRLNVLREYLARDLEMPHLPFEYDFERAIDDWVFMCFFVGNDFLPHLPSLEIREGAIDKLVDLYKRAVSGAEGFITDSGIVNLERVQKIMKDLGKLEDEIFVKRRRSDMIFKQRCQDRRKSEIQSKIEDEMQKGNFEAVRQLRNTKLEEEETPDLVKLWEPGYKDRYYELKFSYTGDTYSRRLQVAKDYVRGLCWVLKYYYQGCASWKWYYPYHYAPFASDFINIAEEEITFEKRTKPFSPLEQLMGVFPAASSSHVPKPYAELMTAKDSTISDFYPDNFNVDLNGKKYAWQGVALLPFVNEIRLKQALKPLEHLLTPEERKRNQLGEDKTYIGKGSECFDFALSLCDGTERSGSTLLNKGILGVVHVSEDSYFQGDMIFKDPHYGENFHFKASRLPGAIDPPKVLRPEDLKKHGPYRPRIGMGHTDSNTRARLSDSSHRVLRRLAAPLRAQTRPSHGYRSMQNGRGHSNQQRFHNNSTSNWQNNAGQYWQPAHSRQSTEDPWDNSTQYFFNQMRTIRRHATRGFRHNYDNMFRRLDNNHNCTVITRSRSKLKMASKCRNMFYENKKQETTEIGWTEQWIKVQWSLVPDAVF